MSRAKDQPSSFTAEVHILFSGYVEVVPPPAIGHVASTVSFVRDGEIRVIIDPGQVPHPNTILEPLAALEESPASITDVIFSHHHPDHTLNAALFPHARFPDHVSILYWLLSTSVRERGLLGLYRQPLSLCQVGLCHR